MKYTADRLKNALSSQYVLGTLSGRARLRYQQLLMAEDALQKNVWDWEIKLNELATSLPAKHHNPKAVTYNHPTLPTISREKTPEDRSPSKTTKK